MPGILSQSSRIPGATTREAEVTSAPEAVGASRALERYLPIGVVRALFGAPFFAIVLRTSRGIR